MITSTGDDMDRTTSGRFVRNLALSLSGGALITLLGATVAQADTGDAGTDSAGTGAAQSGDATATGNQANTSSTQTVTVSGNLGTIQVINQQANVNNVGVAAANTGGNIAIGNASDNTANADQTANGDTGAATNQGEASNGSNGSALISTGNASATGNVSSTNINQTANGSAHGALGGILIINQDALVTNSGVALANSGANGAAGNLSGNDAGLLQEATSNDGSLAANSGAATNASNGKATVATGGASATGNKSDTQITQSATGSAGGALGGLVIIDQDAFVLNAGAAVANSGLNGAVGNWSDSTANVGEPGNPQEAIGGGGPGDVGIASNNGEASNTSDGTAEIWTGAAMAVGNDSATKVTQNANADITGAGGGSLISQDSNVINAGLGLANSGGNFALGNNADSFADVDQIAESPGAQDVGVIGNFGKAANTSDGTGSVKSGGASAAGNRSTTDVVQNAKADGGAFNLQTQGNVVANVGLGLANSGLNAGVGNTSDSDAFVNQDAELGDPGSDVAVLGNFGLASNSSDGTASIETGDATAVGNDSSTTVNQTIDPAGLVIINQASGVLNAGVGIANSGGNVAIGNASNNNATANQDAEVLVGNGGIVDIGIGTLVQSNNGEASNASDGTASIKTGNATGTGNESETNVNQLANGHIGGSGVAVLTQVGGVANVGLGVANSGLNLAVGNSSDNEADTDQDIEVASDNANDVDIDAGILTASNSGTASNASDGTADITTGNATGTGNRSSTNFSQTSDGTVDGLGFVVNTQVGGVLNAGVGLANSGGNVALGNISDNETDLDQRVEVGSDNLGADVFIDATVLTASNTGSAENSSDGTAKIRTGAADGIGNASSTNFSQTADAGIGGAGGALTTQVGGVANVGLGVANSGINLAVGNNSDNDSNGQGADLEQEIELGSENAGDVDIDVFGPLTAANQGTASNTSDGTAEIRTGGAQGSGNVSSTNFAQNSTANVDGMGMAVNTQVGGVLNAGVGIANSGVNGAVGNISDNDADADQRTEIGTDNGGDVELNVIGPLTASNTGESSNTSDGTALVGTGGALATGNASATNLTQNLDTNVEGMGIVVGTQIGGVANLGLGIANSGINGAVGNASDNETDTDQSVEIAEDNAGVTEVNVLGPLTGSNNGSATNSSDGEACVCTGNAVASGNVSSTTLIQDLDLSVGTGAVVITATGGVLNAGVGLANSGVNAALGNISDNDADTDQELTLNGGAPFDAVGPQTGSNSGGASNASTGSGKVGSGNASATGNLSTTDLVQAADVDGDLVIAAIAGGTSNVGLGLANSGLNLGVGNNSTNSATLTQTADGLGTVSNSGTASNESDGTSQIGDPDCDEPKVDEPGKPDEPKAPEAPGVAGLPKTGGELETMAAVGLMLLLAGYGLRRKGTSAS